MSARKFKTFDVRPILAGGEDPYTAIRSRSRTLAPEQGLTIIAPFLPAPLIELLKSEGYSSTFEHRADGSWAVNFWRETPPSPPPRGQN
jgi:hypothetical protein